jgi:ABC-type Fe3+/spermidine/putrescine transport system ATPase subunit
MNEAVPQSVEISAISVRFGKVVPIRNLTLNVEAGELVSILGPSGCGKTTTLRAVAGFNHPFEGDIRIGGKSVINVPANARNVGMMYQSYALFPHKTVAENVAFGLKMPASEDRDWRSRARYLI